MACVFRIQDGKIVGGESRHNFPDEDWPKAIDILKSLAPIEELPDSPLPSVVQFEETPPVYQVPEIVGEEEIEAKADVPVPMDWDKSKAAERVIERLDNLPPQNPGDTQS
jgi:hypothetical protein